ncbi:hypothetical protein HELRODRAFT_177736 [Helobdella robusta]|uniref:Uncharacterized protein n=1 Tax=Helobdella robusta TaxID=6412 RepID=T1FC59_HELRO|nr:hypothetical protein HELRODRAFT_177736 [Helobdella robusta]ESN97681.1 hypothetical protein HELRODRAFT_177736 [Helobdella robusta]
MTPYRTSRLFNITKYVVQTGDVTNQSVTRESVVTSLTTRTTKLTLKNENINTINNYKINNNYNNNINNNINNNNNQSSVTSRSRLGHVFATALGYVLNKPGRLEYLGQLCIKIEIRVALTKVARTTLSAFDLFSYIFNLEIYNSAKIVRLACSCRSRKVLVIQGKEKLHYGQT